MNNPVPIIDDQDYMRSVHHGRSVSDVIGDYNGKNENYFNKKCEVTLLPRLVIDEQLLVPLETCARLVAFKLALEQDEKKEEARRNYLPSSVLTEAELYLRMETIWWLDNNGSLFVDAGRLKPKESDDEQGLLKEVDLNNKADLDKDLDISNDGRDDNGSDDIDIKETPADERLRVLRKEEASDNFVGEELGGVSEDEADNESQHQGAVRRCEWYKTIKDRKYNSNQVGLCWYYE